MDQIKKELKKWFQPALFPPKILQKNVLYSRIKILRN
jgi:hypothetical protein